MELITLALSFTNLFLGFLFLEVSIYKNIKTRLEIALNIVPNLLVAIFLENLQAKNDVIKNGVDMDECVLG